jgi:catechol 2,3-dioxygenase-like lactoylglutathione lyase family enzyme
MQVQAGITFLYYRDLAAAAAFYQDILGLRLARDQGWCKILAMGPSSYVGLVDETRGSLRAAAAKPVMLTFVVAGEGQVDEWHRRLAAARVCGLTTPKLSTEIGVYGFFATDPEGYRLEVQAFSEPLR